MSDLLPLQGRGASPLSVLVADDVPEIVAIVQHWLIGAGCSVMGARSGHEVSRLLLTHSFDLVITDILMPEGDGLEVIAELRRSQPMTRVLAMSGGGHHLRAPDCLKLAKGLGAHGEVLKPFTREQLFEAIRLAMGAPAISPAAVLPTHAPSSRIGGSNEPLPR